jgi:hypothetical protein
MIFELVCTVGRSASNCCLSTFNITQTHSQAFASTDRALVESSSKVNMAQEDVDSPDARLAHRKKPPLTIPPFGSCRWVHGADENTKHTVYNTRWIVDYWKTQMSDPDFVPDNQLQEYMTLLVEGQIPDLPLLITGSLTNEPAQS